MSHASFEEMAVRLTVEHVVRMVETGLLAEGAPFELIDGGLVYKDRRDRDGDVLTVGPRHSVITHLLSRLDAELELHGCWMRSQTPLRISPYDAPQPDGAVVAGVPRDYIERLPGPTDIHAVIEVSDSSLRYDRRVKLALYSRAAIGQYVIVNLVKECLEVHERPDPSEERYETVTVLRRGDRLGLRTGDGTALDVDVARLLP